MEKNNQSNNHNIDWMITLTPFLIISSLSFVLFVFPNEANSGISKVRAFFGDTIGLYYQIIGLGMLTVSIYIAFSKYGKIVLGDKDEKPKYNFFTWGSMMFTCGLAADILFYSFSEWTMYAVNPHMKELGSIDEWVGVFPLFHWSFIPWSFYLVLAVAFGFMLHVRKRSKQRYSEACRPLLNNRSDRFTGRLIDVFALFALLAGTATTFSVATPLLANILIRLFGLTISRNMITIVILVITCTIYTYAVLHGIRGISFLAKICVYLFFGLILAVFLIGGQSRFILENGFQSFGLMIQNFVKLSTFTDPMRKSNFPQDWTIYFWAYWMVWCIAAPFFIGNISKGRTIKQVIIGGYVFGVGSTLISFIVLGNYGLGLQLSGSHDFIAEYSTNGDLYELIISIIDTIPGSTFILAIMLLCMIAFYATSFDSIAFTAACYSYKHINNDEKPGQMITFLWCLLLIALPIALVFSESSMSNIQSVSIISAFPIGIIMIMMVWSFLKDARKCIKERDI